MQAIFLAIAGGIAVHLLSIAATAHLIGVKVRLISLGLGPTLVNLGVFRLCVLPLGGYVKFKDSREEPVPRDEMNTAFDGRGAFEQIVIVLSGCAMLVLLSILLLGREGLTAFLLGPAQVIHGAIAPFSEAQALIAQSLVLSREAAPTMFFGYAAAKLAAMNMLPVPPCNGGAVLAIIGRSLKIDSWWSPNLTKILIFFPAIAFLAWCAAGVVYATGT